MDKNNLFQITLHTTGVGLCNKYFRIFGACEVALEHKYQIIEPYFGWTKKVLMGEIYDIPYFNKIIRDEMQIDYDLIKILTKEDDLGKIPQLGHNYVRTGDDILRNNRTLNKMGRKCMNVVVMKALKLIDKYDDLVKTYVKDNEINDSVSFHIRIESDWQSYSRSKRGVPNETFLINQDKLIQMFLQSSIKQDNVFFTTGQTQESVSKSFSKNNLKSCWFFDKNLEYEINASINFFICCHSKHFVGLCRSTFSNLISLNRFLMNKDSSFIYNLDNKLLKRIDLGLHCDPNRVIKDTVIIE